MHPGRWQALGSIAVLTAALAAPNANARVDGKYCWPGFTIPAVHLPAVHLPATTIPGGTIPGGTIPAGCVGSYCWPATHYPPVHYPPIHVPAVKIPARTIPGTHVPPTCITTSAAFAPVHTTVRIRNYTAVDRRYSPHLTTSYWNAAGRTSYYPDVFASGFGQPNAAGFPKDQYVRPYIRRDGTFVSGYWRNLPTDGLPTCQVISC
jgi:hypothetical protein